MIKAVISDASCLIALDTIGELEILKNLFEEILITPEVKEEIGIKVPGWISVRQVNDKGKKTELEKMLDTGEAGSMALALEIPDCLLIIDEKKGRRIASELKIRIAGTLRILLLAKKKGIILSVKEVVNRLEQGGFRLNRSIKQQILKEADES